MKMKDSATRNWAYIHGELNDEEVRKIELEMDADERLRHALERMRNLDRDLKRLVKSVELTENIETSNAGEQS